MIFPTPIFKRFNGQIDASLFRDEFQSKFPTSIHIKPRRNTRHIQRDHVHIYRRCRLQFQTSFHTKIQRTHLCQHFTNIRGQQIPQLTTSIISKSFPRFMPILVTKWLFRSRVCVKTPLFVSVFLEEINQLFY